MSAESVHIKTRLFTPADVDFALSLTVAEGWIPSRNFFDVFVGHNPDGCFIAERGGERVGMVTTARFEHCAWIGNLVVIPACRSQGIGRKLMLLALQHLKGAGARTIRLEADPPGIRLYRSLGFQDEFESLRFRGTAKVLGKSSRVSSLTIERLGQVAAFDRPRYGIGRGLFLGLLYAKSEIAFFNKEGDRITGYLFVIPTLVGRQIGPFVADDAQSASELLATALTRCRGHTVTVGLPASNRAGIRLLESMGLSQMTSSYRMVWGKGEGSGISTAIYGIANGAAG